MDDDYEFFDDQDPSFFISKGKMITKDAYGNVIIKHAKDSGNQGVIVLCIVIGMVLLFVVGNHVLDTYAQKSFPHTKKKPVSKKKMKRERLKHSISVSGD